jgi:predicted nucleotidyltransferase
MTGARASTSPEDLAREVSRALLEVPSVWLAYLFGSRASGRARPDSDLDVAILYDRTLDVAGREEARRDVLDALSASLGPLGEHADIVDLERCDSGVAFRAIRNGLLALTRSDLERVRTIVAVARRFDDDAPKRALFRRAAQRAMSRASNG